MNKVSFQDYKNEVSAQLVRIESDYYFISSTQVIDDAKEREQC